VGSTVVHGVVEETTRFGVVEDVRDRERPVRLM
jgi:hypothetical protein